MPEPTIPADPAAPLVHRFTSGVGDHLLVIPFSRIYDIATGAAPSSDADWDAATLSVPSMGEVGLDHISEPQPQSISLNVSSSCNLTCGYCYAARGGFGGVQTTLMEWPTARAAIDRLLSGADSESPITIGFLGGEPFVNRKLIHRAVDYAVEQGQRLKLDVRFSVTTNGTLLEANDLEMMRRNLFAVTVSLDGAADVQDRQRRLHRDGSGSWQTVVDRITPLLERPGHAKIAARATVTRHNLDIAGHLTALTAIGFPEVGFAPLRVGPEASGPLTDADWPLYLAALVAASEDEIDRLRRGIPIRLTNLAVALKQLHRGASSPYPCGAGGGYFSVSANGRWYACHRAIGNADFDLGSNEGLDSVRRREFLEKRHVHSQTDCGSCWARYLCSGGCHQEASARTTASCDFIRGWLSFCLETYCELGSALPVAGIVSHRLFEQVAP
ncbi:SPASM domain-containing protein [Mesorhizobium sp. B3-1-3]|uniref:radical SAM/SPASM domain-containing protein n=1 Tax=unclassified Mesorhizobium TaxID=325217 RepID=UPI00112911B7|nr:MULTISPECIES: radical SAM protein [unclassified Mesorhizobium]TPI62535.1 SPASM domain-containing protein [Mesorhizobium sp. B3-1-8]TPI74104.1 SPASM domain-containing protein [Mesorhizobium sp. B3-1-3]